MRRKRTLKTKPIAVLGCGPAGLLAAWAAQHVAGYKVDVYSIVKPSPIGGAQYLHRAIPGLTNDQPETHIRHYVSGDPYGYQRKAYGNGPQPEFVSFSHVHDGLDSPAWNLRGIYQKLWDVFGPAVLGVTVTPKWLKDFITAGDYGLIINSVPRFNLCMNREGVPYFPDQQPRDEQDLRFQEVPRVQHYFQRQKIQIFNSCVVDSAEDNAIWYDGTGDRSWYRASNIFGTGSTEWGAEVRLPLPSHEIVNVYKPVSSNCDCWWDRGDLVHVGRFGKWYKGELTHNAFEDTLNHLEVRL